MWSETPIDSSSFKSVGFENPSANLWPYHSNALQAKEIQIGNYFLNSEQIARLGVGKQTLVQWSPSDEKILQIASQTMISSGFGAFKPRGNYIVASA